MPTKKLPTSKISQDAKARKDRSVIPLIAIALIIAAIASAPFVWAVKLNFDYNKYMKDLRDEFIKGERFDTINALYDEEEFHISKENASTIFTIISQAGMGRVCEPLPHDFDESALIDLGHGSTLYLAPTVMTIEYEEQVSGIYVEYTFANGKVYAYENDKMYFYNIRNVLNKAKAEQ